MTRDTWLFSFSKVWCAAVAAAGLYTLRTVRPKLAPLRQRWSVSWSAEAAAAERTCNCRRLGGSEVWPRIGEQASWGAVLDDRAARAIAQSRSLIAERKRLMVELALNCQRRSEAAHEAVQGIRKAEANLVDYYRRWPFYP